MKLKLKVPIKMSHIETERLLSELDFCQSDYISEFIHYVVQETKKVAASVKGESEKILTATSLDR